MKICHISSVHNAFDNRIYYKECLTLAENGYDVTLVAPKDDSESQSAGKVKIIYIKRLKNRFFRLLISPLAVLKTVLQLDVDLYHFHDPELLPVGIILKILTSKAVIYDVHEDYGKQILSKPYIPKVARKGIASLIKVTEYFISIFFDGIITATDDILKNFSYHKRVISIKNFPVLSNFSTPIGISNDNKQRFDLIYVGNLVEVRGIFQIVQALEFINPDEQIRLTLCGKFYPKDYEEKVRGLRGFEKVTYLGWIESGNVPNLLYKANAGIVCLYPTTNYLTALPVKLFEYMAAGLPVVASNFPLWKQIIEGNNCGICVDPLDPKEIAKTIEYLIGHPEEAKKMGENGIKAVKELYNWEKESRKLIGAYSAVLNKERSGK